MAKKAGEVNMEEGQICWPPGQGVSVQAVVRRPPFEDHWSQAISVEPSVAGGCAARGLDRFGQSSADRAQDKRRDFALRR